ncbi:MAG TPA: hypothetical protein VGD23_07235 [Sphingomicrobium sp.]
MAKAKTAAAPKAKKKSAKAKAAPVKVKKGGSKSKGSAVDALLKIADHPLVGELVAIGATAAVAAIAQQGLGKSKKGGSNKAVKEAGKAAAAAIGARLISEFAEDKAAKKAKPAKA